MTKSRIALLFLPMLVSGCAVHPLPEDYSQVVTEQIVRQIRCEAQASLRDIIVEKLSQIDTKTTDALVVKYRGDIETTRDFSPDLFKKDPELSELYSVIDLFYKAGVAYNFDFDMYEDNNIGGGVDLLKPLTSGAFTFGVNASANRKRENERSFTVTDTFSSTLKLPRWYCGGQSVEANYAYPITGKIGIEKVLRTYIAMTLFGGLGPKVDPKDTSSSKDGSKNKAPVAKKVRKKAPNPGDLPELSGPPTWAEMLAFTTTLSASASPKVVFTPMGQSFQVADSMLSVAADRTDIHKVTIGLAIAKDKVINIDPLRNQFLGGQSGTLIVGRHVTGGGTPSQQLAVLAIDQFQRGNLEAILNNLAR